MSEYFGTFCKILPSFCQLVILGENSSGTPSPQGKQQIANAAENNGRISKRELFSNRNQDETLVQDEKVCLYRRYSYTGIPDWGISFPREKDAVCFIQYSFWCSDIQSGVRAIDCIRSLIEASCVVIEMLVFWGCCVKQCVKTKVNNIFALSFKFSGVISIPCNNYFFNILCRGLWKLAYLLNLLLKKIDSFLPSCFLRRSMIEAILKLLGGGRPTKPESWTGPRRGVRSGTFSELKQPGTKKHRNRNSSSSRNSATVPDWAWTRSGFCHQKIPLGCLQQLTRVLIPGFGRWVFWQVLSQSMGRPTKILDSKSGPPTKILCNSSRFQAGITMGMDWARCPIATEACRPCSWSR